MIDFELEVNGRTNPDRNDGLSVFCDQTDYIFLMYYIDRTSSILRNSLSLLPMFVALHILFGGIAIDRLHMSHMSCGGYFI